MFGSFAKWNFKKMDREKDVSEFGMDPEKGKTGTKSRIEIQEEEEEKRRGKGREERKER